ncbi:restriction endonuclease [Prauserella sp. PE36]|nr:restriction endonuclease [Prauserella sp. PE36]
MTVPQWQELMAPIMRQLTDGRARHWRELRDGCVTAFGLSDTDCAEKIASGKARLDNRVQWAVSHMFQARLIERPRRGFAQLTRRGREVLDERGDEITPDYLLRFSEYRDFRSRTRAQGNGRGALPAATDAETPLENIADAVAEATSALHGELLKRIIEQPPEFLEKLALTLLNAMGYGDAAGSEHRGRSGDGGIDGAIRQDALGLNTVYLQAKRYTDAVVGRPDMQKFVGALHGVGADRGVFVTTSQFSQEARDYVERIPNRIVLIDGQRLAELMVQHDIGVQVKDTFVLKRIDEDFFDE